MKKNNQEKYIETFDEVHVPEALMGKVIEMGKQKKEHKRWGRGKIVAAAACALCVVSVTTVSATNLWKNYAYDRYGIQNSKVQGWKDEKLLQENNVFVEKNGVRVACKEVIASGPFAHVLLEVSLDDSVEMGEDPSFASACCAASEGELEAMRVGVPTSLYEPELMIDRENKVFYLEYQLKLEQEAEKESDISWDGQILTVSLQDFGNRSNDDKVEVEPIISQGEWELNIPMESYDKTVTVQTNQDFGNGFILKEFTLSPISIGTIFESAETPDENTEEPVFTAYETKDGEKIEVRKGLSVFDYDGKRIKDSFMLEKVVDIEYVAAVYFDDVKVEVK